jgi:hypothetical protein
LFKAVDHDRKITGRGKLIIIYDPKKEMSTPPYWQYNNIPKDGSSDVLAGFKVRVIGAFITFT